MKKDFLIKQMILIKYLPVYFSSDIVYMIILMLRERIPLIN